MNLGRKLHENGDGSMWILSTPDKPILQMPQVRTGEENQSRIPTVEENWQDLIGIYTGVLQNGPPQNLNLNSIASPSPKGHNMQCVAPEEVYNNMLQQNSNPAMEFGMNSNRQSSQNVNNQIINPTCVQDFRTQQKFASYNQENARSVDSSSVQNSDEVAAPRKVNSLAELLGMARAMQAPPPNGSISVGVGPSVICRHSPVESNNQVANTSSPVGAKLQQSHISHSHGDIGSCNLQEMTNSTFSVRNYNLNLPPRPETGESLSSPRPLPFGPITPCPQKQSKTYQLSQGPNFLTDGISTQEKCAQNNVVVSSPLPDILTRGHSGILLSTPSEAVAANENVGIDLNKTPQQKPPRRKKHRPKVIREGKPKRTPTPAADAKRQTPDGNSKLKRKYVGKNTINASETPSANAVNAIETSNEGLGRGPAKKSKIRKRKLNFDPEIGAKRESQDKGLNSQVQNSEGGNKLPFNLNLEADHSDFSTEFTGPSAPTGNKNNFVHLSNKVAPQDSLALVSMAPPKNHPLNVIARILNTRNSSASQSTHVHHCISEGLAPRIIHSNSSLPNSYTTRQSTVHNMTPQLVDVNEIQGAKMRHPLAITVMGSQLWSNEVSDTGRYNRDNSDLDTDRKTNADNTFHGTSSSCTHSGLATIGEFSEKIGSKSKNLQISEWENSGIRGHSISGSPNDKSNKLTRDWCVEYPDLRPKVHQQHASSQVHLSSEQVAPPRISSSLTVVTNWNKGYAPQRDHKSIPINAIVNSTERVQLKRPMAQQTPSCKGPVVDKRLELDAKNRRNYRNPSKKVAELQEICVDYITNLLRDLHIENNKEQSVFVSYEGDGSVVPYKGDNAVVPYREDGAVVPYEEFDPVRKRRPRARVDLDPETNRLWNLLMGKEGSQSAETMDNNKQKWWEEERKVFRGRVDSFIARMHLVQGDRRFSKWKGSVVDSVIGVFLTQNVSDHLSSSAFMSLAAKFPLNPSTACHPFEKNGVSLSGEHHEVRISYPDGTTYKQNIPREPADNHSTVTSTESSEYMAKNVMTEKRTILGNYNTNKTEEDFISSQSSSESFVFQAFEDIRSSSGSNSEGDDVRNLGKNLGYLSEPYEGIMGSYKGLLLGQNQVLSTPARSTTYSDPFVSNVPCNQPSALPSTNYWSGGLEKWEEDVLGFSGNESISTLASTEFEITNRNHATLNEHPELKTDSRDKSGKRISQETFQQAGTSLTDSTKPAEAFSKQPGGTIYEPAKASQANSSEKHVSDIGTTSPNSRKRKAEKEKVELFDWDILRKQVQSKGGTRERCRETMDSLDYEKLRNADISEISAAIKERGMNNMLAERMKSFLNRLVQDHERIDLEWLRDVDPDKVKDYLLSIRGLGLKSVECVRLLTLHHLAFPVDTNVGRIAVRLGWVPLQPLPESLQLHLLELYPVLETIQKYLWPRLCKLDQETLYELHYQMITFGKVFCTKREPNCNGCPMRGECRHFASAFASARLALPGPEEKGIVSSSVAPVTPNKGPDAIIKPLLLNSSEGNRDGGITGLTRNSEPLIEEPLSPEPPIEVSERDIEDAFYEDPDEIPIIKLDVQEFTTNLQSFMQEQMELGEVDMSKALVALSPDFASIPIPKLKHVSRLRTEHQVYELPDSHALLKGMDRREPDDPSPYLLAIWTPGETADSIQPPESACSSQEDGGGLCNNETCFSCSSSREAQAQTVRGTILVPCRTAMRGSFPLNGTYFQVNEVFADHESSLNPIDVPRRLLWNLPRRTVYFGSSVTSIFKGLTTEGIQYCFWKGFICVRGFDQKTRAPKPLKARLHIPASRVAKKNE